MLNWLLALVLLAPLPLVPAVCPAVPLPAVVTGGMVVVVPCCRSIRADFVVAARFARDTARNGRAEDEDGGGPAEGGGYGDGGPVTPAGVAAVMPDLRAVGIAEPAGVEPQQPNRSSAVSADLQRASRLLGCGLPPSVRPG
jgi:hypothetical protein